MQYAGFWLRVIAIIVDVIVMIIPSFAVSWLFGLILTFNLAEGGLPYYIIVESAEATGFLVSIFMYWIYFTALESSKLQATIGKKAVGIKVVDINGNRITFGRAAARNLSRYFSGMIMGIGYLMAGWTKKKQALHDIIADTLVVKNDD